jgi:phosphatidylglycerophosphatase A
VKSPSRFLAVALASCGFLTFLPAALTPGESRSTGAGLIGTVAGLVTLKWLPVGFWPQCWMLLGGLLISVAVSEVAEETLGRKDDPRIVIDEWIGVWITLAFLPRGTVWLVLGFILFRVFDVWKPGAVRLIGDWPGGWGVVMDDVLAGVAANVLLHTINFIHPL